MSFTQYQQLAEPVLVPPRNILSRVTTPMSRRRRFQYQSFVQPLEPSLFVIQKMDWLVQHPGPVLRKIPYPERQFVEPFVPGLRFLQPMDWYLEHPGPTLRPVPAAPGQMFGLPDYQEQISTWGPSLFFQPEIPARTVQREIPWQITEVVDPSVAAVTPTGWNLTQPEIMPRQRFRTAGESFQVMQTIAPPVLMSHWYMLHQMPVPRRRRLQSLFEVEPLEPSLRVTPDMGWLNRPAEIPVRQRPPQFGLLVEPYYPQWPVPVTPGCPYEPPTEEAPDTLDSAPESTADYLPPTEEGSDYLPGSIDTCQ